jgi:hypothetical protein
MPANTRNKTPAEATLGTRSSVAEMLAALRFALPYMEDLANSSDNKGEKRAARLMRQAISKAEKRTS